MTEQTRQQHQDMIHRYVQKAFKDNELVLAAPSSVTKIMTICVNKIVGDETAALRAQLAAVTKERDEWKNKHDYVRCFFDLAITERDELRIAKESLIKAKTSAQAEVGKWKDEAATRTSECSHLESRTARLENVIDKLVWQRQGRYDVCKFCEHKYPEHEDKCEAKQALAEGD